METTQDLVQILRQVFEERRRQNPRYSLRAFARDLRLQAPTLSHILNGHRGLPARHVPKVLEALGPDCPDSMKGV